jgi:signal transduction histidine kinase/ActR/RegA family two-component response regulator
MISPVTSAISVQPHRYQRNSILYTVAIWAVMLVALTIVLVMTANVWSNRIADNLQAEQLVRRQSDLWHGIEAQWSDHAIDAINQAARIPEVVEALSRKDKGTLNQHLSTRFNGLAQARRFDDWILLDAQAHPFLSLATPDRLFASADPVLVKAVALAAGRAKLVEGADGSLWYVTPIQDQRADLVGWMCIKAETSSLLRQLRIAAGQAALLQLPDGRRLVAVAGDERIFAANPHRDATTSEATLDGRRYQICGTALGAALRLFIAYDVTESDAAMRQARWHSTVTTVVLVTALLAVGLLILRYRLRPIYSLRDAMLVAHETGKFNVRVDAKGAGEVALLALAFNAMSDRIQEQFDQLERTNDALKIEIAERKSAENGVREAREEADRANRAKSEFLSRMSHELRTPMNAILGFAQLLEMDELTADQQEGVAHIIRGGRHLLELINEILDLARIEAGRMSLSPEPVEIAEALREAIELMRPLAAERQVQLITPASYESHVLADRQRLKQVLINLISNSIKYNRPGGSVTLTCILKDSRARIFVKDTGIGIPAGRIEQLFTPFERLGAEQGSVEGTGLGLAVAKRLVEAMEGAIGVESVAGEGTTFWLEFPLTESPLVRSKLAEEAFETQVETSKEKRTVLCIEDNDSNLRLIERVLLRRAAVELLAARNGVQGLELARHHFPDLILLDLNLPDIDGREVLQRLQTDPRCSAIPVVVLSADATSGQRERFLRAGAAEYLTKPLNVKKFLQVLDQTLAGSIPLEVSRNSNLSREFKQW